MSSVIQKERTRAGAGDPSTRGLVRKFVNVTMTAGATASGSIVVPEGSHLAAVRGEVAAAFSGAPTNINLRLGSAAAGQEVVADTDVKAQGHFALTIVSSFNAIAGVVTYFYQLAANGGTNPAGTVTLCVDYYPPNP